MLAVEPLAIISLDLCANASANGGEFRARN